jgi:hypothetical protein
MARLGQCELTWFQSRSCVSATRWRGPGRGAVILIAELASDARGGPLTTVSRAGLVPGHAAGGGEHFGPVFSEQDRIAPSRNRPHAISKLERDPWPEDANDGIER